MQQMPSAHDARVSVGPDPSAENLAVPAEELAVLRDHYPNVMLVGSDAAIAAALCEMQTQFRQPVASVEAQQLAEMPLTLPRGALVIRGISGLSKADQRRLHEWLGPASGATQVIATSAVPIYPFVEGGTFLDALYYRLNTVYLVLVGSRV
jgi:hypothetical protein